jgi:hypothetical protein
MRDCNRSLLRCGRPAAEDSCPSLPKRDERGFVRAPAFSADGKTLVSANADTTAWLL